MRVLYFMFLICGPTWPAPDAAGAAPSLARFIELGVCCQPCRSTYPPAAQVRPSVGPLAARKAVAGQPRQRDIIGDNRTYSGHFRAFPGLFRAFPGIVGHERIVVCRIVRRRITYGHARRVPYGLSPDRVRRACCVPYRPSPDHVPYRPSPTHVSSQLGPPSATSVSLPSSPLGTPNARRLPCPGPTYACSRRRQPWFTNVYSFTLPWRFIMARSAARLRRIVGPLSTRYAVAGQTEQPDIIGNN